MFPRACVIVHHGGIGTTGKAMHAGRPMLVVPYCHDQPDHAAPLCRLGAARSVPREHYNFKIAAREIDVQLQDKRYAERASEIGTHVHAQSGVTTACDLIENLVNQNGSKELCHGKDRSV